jgi:hypothetical protein
MKAESEQMMATLKDTYERLGYSRGRRASESTRGVSTVLPRIANLQEYSDTRPSRCKIVHGLSRQLSPDHLVFERREDHGSPHEVADPMLPVPT